MLQIYKKQTGVWDFALVPPTHMKQNEILAATHMKQLEIPAVFLIHRFFMSFRDTQVFMSSESGTHPAALM